jgi:type III restriction enzyme
MSASLYQRLAERVGKWRDDRYSVEQHPTIGEILDWAKEPEGSGFRLRPPQVRALETYWYLRLIEQTPHVSELYRLLFPKQSDLLAALGLQHEDIKAFVLDNGMDALFARIKTDDDFAHEYRLESLRETLTLDYPSYILALAMGAGKTALIGAIIATEFAMALEYPTGPFVQNALVFAPGTTIIESLRELAQIPYDRILPPRLYKPFAASVKLTFTRDGEKDIPVIRGSVFNVVVTNTEKIRIQKETIRKSDIGSLFAPKQQDEARAEIANLRLQAIASLPHLAVFSDEAHHTYGQALDTELKKVRKTVDYLHQNSPNLICVVNTTGTPYFQRQPLRDVVVWYGLSQGIRDNILKEVANNIQAFTFDDANTDQFIRYVITDFFKDYGNVTLPNGAPAKLALYFPQNDDLTDLRPAVETALAKLGLSPTLCLRNTSESTQAEVDAFNRLNDPTAPHRVVLLVNKGTEGWNCPSLFACALARRLKTSNNFVLQAASRCLRQVPGNNRPARIYLSADNRSVLDRQLQETYGESISDLDRAKTNTRSAVIQLRKVKLPPLVVRQLVRTVVRKNVAATPLKLTAVYPTADAGLKKETLTVAEQQSTKQVLRPVGNAEIIQETVETIDLYTAAVELAATYRLDLWPLYEEVRRIYPGQAEIPVSVLPALAKQIEDQTRNYEVREETVERALALVKPDGFQRRVADDGTEFYTAEISYPIDRHHLLASWKDWQAKADGLGFHYDPYNFDSNPEQNFFEQLLAHLKQRPADVEDIYFTGAITDPNKTDFYVEYRGEDDQWHRYTPDFIIRRKDGKCLIVEIKSERERAHPIDGENGRKAMATRKLVGLNPDRLKYQIIFARADVIGHEQLQPVRQFVEE